MRKSIIVAVSQNGVIGVGGKIPWHLPADLKRFKELTMGHHLVMGRRTYESIGRPLPGRTTIVLTRRTPHNVMPPGVRNAAELSTALEFAKHNGETEVFICGGGEVYKQALLLCDRVYLTIIEREYDGDTWFHAPHLASPFGLPVWGVWKRVEVTHVEGDALPYRYETWERGLCFAPGSED